MRKTLGIWTVLSLCLVAAALPAAAMEVDINFILGVKAIDDNNAWDNDQQAAFGIETTFGKSGWPVKVAIDYFGSAAEQEKPLASPVPGTVNLLRATTEFDFGVRKIWKEGKARPFVGGGIGFLTGIQETNVQLAVMDDSDTTAGLWIQGGAFWRLTRKFNIGVDLRLSGGEVTLFGNDVEVGGATLGLLLGWGWGDPGHSRSAIAVPHSPE